ncbi:acyl-CoA N-acyltransferase [Roridomyces roridus]|uniref:Acyl-CoA N-acyltransferase n=1 Tax=Roridomyces roridus TaxID=1738132 RepID=A0AAD7FUE4_9AGAR|nr:acyl-CoA N-acyltransferase [Roridomyces roridus]
MIPESGLESPRVKLTPYLSLTHNGEFFAQLAAHPDLSRLLPVPFTPTFIQQLLDDPNGILLAVIDKTSGQFAGTIGPFYTSFQHLTTEIGPVICFPEFQRIYVTSHAIGTLLRHCFELPKDGGMGFKRVQWTTNSLNTASIKGAERMGLKVEATLRWSFVLPAGADGKEAGEGRGEAPGRDSVLLATYWDEWEDGGRQRVTAILDSMN